MALPHVMRNPWLDVPLADYEGHMRSAAVGQLQPLADLFAEALACRQPQSVALLGIAGGNGLECVDPQITKRIVGLDINPSYLEAIKQRYAGRSGLELHCVDLAEQTVVMAPVELVHAALIFEHAGTGRCLDNAVALVAEGGALSVVLQLPSDSADEVGASGVESVGRLRAHFTLIDPLELKRALAARDFRLAQHTRRGAASGKGFWMGIFERA